MPPGLTKEFENSGEQMKEETFNDGDLFSGFKEHFLSFKRDKYLANTERFQKLADTRASKFTVIACAAFRVYPSNILGFQPGDAFMVRNVANLVPPFEDGPSETKAALEFSLNSLQVENILVIGHSPCGVNCALMSMPEEDDDSRLQLCLTNSSLPKPHTRSTGHPHEATHTPHGPPALAQVLLSPADSHPSSLPTAVLCSLADFSSLHSMDEASVQVDHANDNDVSVHEEIRSHEQGIDENKRRSSVWLEYIVFPGKEFDDGKQRAQCKHCLGKTYIADSHYGTKNLENHLEKCKNYQSIKESQVQRGTSKPIDQQVYRELVCKAIIRHGYAFSWIEHEGNRDIHVYLNNQVKFISRNTIKADCLKLHVKLKMELKETLQNLLGRISLTCDLWTSDTTEGYICLTAHYVDHEWKLNSKILNFRHLPPPHNGAILYETVHDLLKEWGIENKIFSITLDNASSNHRMQDFLKDQLRSQGGLVGGGDYFHIKCSAHVLNLIVQDGLKKIDASVIKARDSVKYVKGSEARKLKFKDCVKRSMGNETKSLWLDVVTRWNSTYTMLDRVLLYRRAFEELARCDPSYSFCPEFDEWYKLEKIHELLEPFCDITDLFSGSDYPTSNLYFENVWSIDMLLKVALESSDLSVREMAKCMREKFDKYWSDYSMVFVFAVVLDPRCKLSFVEWCYNELHEDSVLVQMSVKEVYHKLDTLFKEYVSQPSSTISSLQTTNANGQSNGQRKRKHNFTKEFDQSSHSTNGPKSKLDIYLEDPRLERDMELDVLSFWKDKQNQNRYGELAFLARDILSVPITIVASESAFSIGGRVLNKWRSSLLSENVEVLITTRSWLYGYESYEDDRRGDDVDWASTKDPSSTSVGVSFSSGVASNSFEDI